MYFRQRILNWVAVALLLFSFSHFRISTGDVRQLTMTIVFVSTGVLGPYINALIAHLRKKNDGAAPS